MNIEKKHSISKPSARSMTLAVPVPSSTSLAHISTTTDESTASGISFVRVARRTAIGATMAVMPTIMRMLKMLLPTTLPIDSSALPSRAESTLTDNSGVEVPKATTVSPMTIDEIRKRLASDEAPSVRKSAPKRIRASPATSKSTFIIIF